MQDCFVSVKASPSPVVFHVYLMRPIQYFIRKELKAVNMEVIQGPKRTFVQNLMQKIIINNNS